MLAATFAGTQWMADAVCATIPEFTELHITEQRTVCADCPVVADCLEFGLQQELPNPMYTVGYGGRSAPELVKLARELGYRRPGVFRQ